MRNASRFATDASDFRAPESAVSGALQAVLVWEMVDAAAPLRGMRDGDVAEAGATRMRQRT